MSDSPQDPLVTSLAACAQGDGQALERVYRLASPHLYAQLLRIVRNESAAQDCLQQVFIRVWQSAGQYDASRAKPMTWLSTLTRNIGIDWLRRQRPQEADGQALIDELAGLDDPAADGQRDQESSQLHECLEILPAKQRQVLELAFFHGLTHSELAGAITQPLGTVKSWVRRGLERLKSCLTTGI